MKKLIELDAALEGLENLNAVSFYEANEHSKEAYTETKAMLKALPSVDAVPVVRCKDCKYWKTAEGVNRSKKVKFCTYPIGHRYARCDEDFCSRGERKDGDGNG